MNCVERFFASDFSRSHRPALVFFDGLGALKKPNKNITFSQLRQNALRAQRALEDKGLKRSDTVLLFEAPSPDMYAMILAMLASGITIMLVEPWLPLGQINGLIAKLKPKAFMTGIPGKVWGARSKEIRAIPQWFSSKELRQQPLANGELRIEDMNEDEFAILTFTSGTSGAPKGVHRKHRFLIDQAAVLEKHLLNQTEQGLDLTIFANVALLNLGVGKGSLLMPSSWPAKAIKALDSLPPEYQVASLAAGPAFLLRLMQEASASGIKEFYLGGALADCWIYEEAFKRWPNANFTHIYGSSEAEPVALANLREAVEKSKAAGFFQTLCLGSPIDEIKLDRSQDCLWVSGPHVSPLYEGDGNANAKNKRMDQEGRVWHNMGDRILERDGELWYGGRDFQTAQDFNLEQKLYQALGHSKCFIHRQGEEVALAGELNPQQTKAALEFCPPGTKFLKAKIQRDKRHRSRIDRHLTLKKAKYARV